MSAKSKDEIRDAVRERYAGLAGGGAAWMQGSGAATEGPAELAPAAGGCCGPATAPAAQTAPATASCCGPAVNAHSAKLGYSSDDQALLPEGADLGLGCGNPKAIAALQPGEVVLDLGSGAGIDCFLAAAQVGPSGRVIGVDMTPEMLAKAKANSTKGDWGHVEFRLGEIEHLPVADNSVDVIISNCVINLSPDKPQVFREALRVLKPGGRLAISDVVATAELSPELRNDMRMLSGCIGGAALVDDLEAILREAGFARIRIRPKSESREFIREWAPGGKVEDYVQSATIEAVKPA